MSDQFYSIEEVQERFRAMRKNSDEISQLGEMIYMGVDTVVSEHKKTGTIDGGCVESVFRAWGRRNELLEQ